MLFLPLRLSHDLEKSQKYFSRKSRKCSFYRFGSIRILKNLKNIFLENEEIVVFFLFGSLRILKNLNQLFLENEENVVFTSSALWGSAAQP